MAELRDEVLRRLRRIMSVDAAFFGTVDPETLLFTSAAAEEPLGAATPLFLDNEYGRLDVNKFAALAEAADPVGSLDRATRSQRPDSARYREVMSRSAWAMSCARSSSTASSAGARSACTARTRSTALMTGRST